jgi:hypothetical protein
MTPYKSSECPRCGAPIFSVADPSNTQAVPRTVFSCECHKFLQLPDVKPLGWYPVPGQTITIPATGTSPMIPLCPYIAPVPWPNSDVIIKWSPMQTQSGTVGATYGPGGFGIETKG